MDEFAKGCILGFVFILVAMANLSPHLCGKAWADWKHHFDKGYAHEMAKYGE